MARDMKEQLIQWANAGDGDCMFKLAIIYRNEGKIPAADEWLVKSAKAKNFFAMKEYAAILHDNGDDFAARELYKEIVDFSGDWQAMENLLDISQDDSAILKFILKKIDNMYNEIYLRDYQILRRTWDLGTRRHNECTIQTLAAVERRRIASRIRKLLAAN